jgi:hypothetical protein
MAVIRHYASILAGVLGAVVISQLPSFTLQYMHNLNGRLDEIRPIVQEFAADLVPYNYTVATALAECQISDGLLDVLCDSFAEIVVRYDMLFAHYEMLQAQTDYRRPLVLATGTAHRDIVESVMEEFQPAVPVDDAGLVFAGVGFVASWVLFHITWWLLCLPCRQRQRQRRHQQRTEKEKQFVHEHIHDGNFL